MDIELKKPTINFLRGKYLDSVKKFSKNTDWKVVTSASKQLDEMRSDRLKLKNIIYKYKKNKDCDLTYLDDLNNIYNQMENPYKYVVDQNYDLHETSYARVYIDPANNASFGTYGKLILFLDLWAKNYITYFSMANQIDNYVCGFKDLFKRITDFVVYLQDGSIAGYFDYIQSEFQSEFLAYVGYVNEKTDCDFNDRVNKAFIEDFTYQNETYHGFGPTWNEYLAKLTEGFESLQNIIEALFLYIEDLQLAVKIIGAANLTLFADEEDQKTLLKNTKNNFSFLLIDPDSLQNISNVPNSSKDPNYLSVKNQTRIRELQAVSLSVSFAITYGKDLNKLRSNLNPVMISTVNAVFQTINILHDIQKIKNVLNTQVPPTD